MKKWSLAVILLAVPLLCSACMMPGGVRGSNKGNAGGGQGQVTEALDLIESEENLKAFVQEYEMEEDGNMYTLDDPELELYMDDDGFLTFFDLKSKGLKVSGVKVGDDFSEGRLDSRLKKFEVDDEFTSSNGRYYVSNEFENEWFVYIRSKDGQEVDRIVMGLSTKSNLKDLEQIAAVEESEEETETSQVAESSLPPETTAPPTSSPVPATMPPQTAAQPLPPQTVQVPQTVVQYVIVPGGSSEYIIPDSSSRYLSAGEINSLDPTMARYALNEIYAKHGRRFNDQELQSYFDSKSWYFGTVAPGDFREDWLSAIEKENVRKLNIRRDGAYVN